MQRIKFALIDFMAQHLSKAVDKVRSTEHKAFIKEYGESPLTKTKHQWLKNSGKTDNRTRGWFMELTKRKLKTARAWAIKETAAKLWGYTSKMGRKSGIHFSAGYFGLDFQQL